MTTPMYEDWPDEAFPFMSGLGHQALVILPDRGSGIVQRCTACGREVWFGGKDLCRLFPAWLTRDVWAWAAAMRCDDCPSPRQSFHALNDLGAHGFHRGPGDPEEAQRIRRLTAWLPEGGLTIDDVAYLIHDVNPVKLRDAKIEEDVIMLFTSPYSASHYHPTRQPARAEIPSA